MTTQKLKLSDEELGMIKHSLIMYVGIIDKLQPSKEKDYVNAKITELYVKLTAFSPEEKSVILNANGE